MITLPDYGKTDRKQRIRGAAEGRWRDGQALSAKAKCVCVCVCGCVVSFSWTAGSLNRAHNPCKQAEAATEETTWTGEHFHLVEDHHKGQARAWLSMSEGEIVVIVS